MLELTKESQTYESPEVETAAIRARSIISQSNPMTEVIVDEDDFE